MPYDPNFPPFNAELISAQWRDQFHGLKDLIDAQAATIAAFQAQVASLQTDLASHQTQINNRATLADLTNAIAGTANNVNAVLDLSGLTISDPPTLAEVVAILDKLNELINTAHR